MNADKTGKLILDMRTKKNLTQKQLADLINVSDKTVCKWETGRGCPDITILPALSKVLEVDIKTILLGELAENKSSGGNMSRVKIYRCSDCGNIIHSTNEIELSCCSRKLEALKISDQKIVAKYQDLIGEFYITFDSPMTKKDFISAVVAIGNDRITLIHLYPEQEAAVSLPQIGGVDLFIIDNKNELKKVVL